MKFIPYESYCLRTQLSREEVTDRLEKNVTAPKFIRFKIESFFEGYVDNGRFELKRSINYRNPFNPRIRGSVCVNKDGRTYVRIAMFPTVVSIVLFIYLQAILIIIGKPIVSFLIKNGKFYPGILVILVMMLAIYGMVLWGFNSERIKI